MSNGLSVTDTLGDQLDIGANASGGTGPYTWTVTGLPAGVTARGGIQQCGLQPWGRSHGGRHLSIHGNPQRQQKLATRPLRGSGLLPAKD